MECQDVRAALSARIDGEAPRPGWDDDVVDAHLAGCAECTAWYAKAMMLNRSLKVRPVQEDAPAGPSPDFAETFLAAVPKEALPVRRPWAVASLAMARIGLVVLAAVYIVWAIVLLHDSSLASSQALAAAGTGATSTTGGQVGASADPQFSQLFVDAATVRMALAIGLCWVAWRPTASAGMIPLCGALWAFSAGFAARDIVLGIASWSTVYGVAIFILTLLVLVWTWISNYGATPEAARGSFQSLRARPVRTTLSHAHDAAQTVERDQAARRHDPLI